mgnify:CR=1 FL=1
MEKRKILALMVLMTTLLLPLASKTSAQIEEENVWDYEGTYEDYIAVEVTTPAQAYPGDEITIEVLAEAQEDLEDVVVDIWVVGTLGEGTESWESDVESGVIDVSTLDEGDDETGDCSVEIPEDVDPGLICGYIYCEFYSMADFETYSFETGFPITYLLGAITQEEFEALQEDYAKLQASYTDLSSKYSSLQTSYNSLKSDYDSLKATYDSLKSSYDPLKSKYDTLVSDHDVLQKEYSSLDSEHKTLLDEYDALKSEHEATTIELSNYTTYTYALAITTIIFVVTTIIFAVRKPSR